jgi:hypothetical protein
MAPDEDLAERMRTVLAGTGAVREVRMFGGLCFILNGNMVAGTSKRSAIRVLPRHLRRRRYSSEDSAPVRRGLDQYVASPGIPDFQRSAEVSALKWDRGFESASLQR